MSFHRTFNKSNTKCVTIGDGTTYPFGVSQIAPEFCEVQIAQFKVLCVVICRSLLLSLFFLFNIVLSVRRLTASAYLCGIFAVLS